MKYCLHCRALRMTLQLLDQGEAEERCSACSFRFEEVTPVAQPLPAQGEKVLCIDDDPLVRELLLMTLAKRGFTALLASDGTTGLAVAAAERPRLLLIDLMMPGLDGYEVCRRLRADPRTASIPQIILTAVQDPKLAVKAFQAGADLALTKPFHPDRLIATLRAALAMKTEQPTP